RNLAALWFAEFTAIFGFSFAFPFLSIFINQDLGVNPGRDLDLWTAAAGSVSGLSMAIANPLWGVLGDRLGRKPMLVRSMVGGALTVGLIAFVQSPTQLVILRFLQGATSGTVAAATALVAVETPRNRVGWSLGVVTSAVALGGAIGPVIGGLAAVATSAAAVFYTFVTWRLGYVRTTAIAAILMAAAIALIAVAPLVSVVVGAVALNGLLSGVIVPATASMIGLETPSEAQSTV